MKKSTTKTGYKEPDDYMPKEIRKKYGLGEFATKKKTTKKKSAK